MGGTEANGPGSEDESFDGSGYGAKVVVEEEEEEEGEVDNPSVTDGALYAPTANGTAASKEGGRLATVPATEEAGPAPTACAELGTLFTSLREAEAETAQAAQAALAARGHVCCLQRAAGTRRREPGALSGLMGVRWDDAGRGG